MECIILLPHDYQPVRMRDVSMWIGRGERAYVAPRQTMSTVIELIFLVVLGFSGGRERKIPRSNVLATSGLSGAGTVRIFRNVCNARVIPHSSEVRFSVWQSRNLLLRLGRKSDYDDIK